MSTESIRNDTLTADGLVRNMLTKWAYSQPRSLAAPRTG
jgi:hypothetical protein